MTRSAVFALVFVAAPARAQRCPVPSGASARLSSMPASDRIAFIHATMDQQAHYTRIWKWTWVGIGSATVVASTAATVVFAAGSDPARVANMIDNGVAAVVSIATPIVTVAFAPRVERDAAVLDELLRATDGGKAGTCLVLERAEELFAKSAADEDVDTGWLAHTVSILGAGALFAFMAVEAAYATDSASRDAHWQNAIINGVAGVAYAEAQILTTPTGASRGHKRYLAGDLRGKPAVSVTVLPMLGGAALAVSF